MCDCQTNKATRMRVGVNTRILHTWSGFEQKIKWHEFVTEDGSKQKEMTARGELHFLLSNFSTFFGPDEKTEPKRFLV